MEEKSIYIASDAPAVIQAAVELNQNGISFTADPDEARLALCDVPTPAFMLEDIPKGLTVIGGNLKHLDPRVPRFDLLEDPYYLAHNALLTAEAALGLLVPKLSCALADAETLILGWGRIGKCLDQLLRSAGMPVSVYARKESDRAMLSALGYTAVTLEQCRARMAHYKCIINTAPAAILTQEDLERAPKGCVKLDLASVLGLSGPDVLHARGLPGKYKAEASGKLIARAILRRREEVFG